VVKDLQASESVEIFHHSGSKSKPRICMQLAGENALRESGAVYTIVRPGRFYSGPSGERKIIASILNLTIPTNCTLSIAN
jgi:hypothetical protein